jgi:hypothetical protein
VLGVGRHEPGLGAFERAGEQVEQELDVVQGLAVADVRTQQRAERRGDGRPVLARGGADEVGGLDAVQRGEGLHGGEAPYGREAMCGGGKLLGLPV